ncbi:MAG: GldG family protein [Gammaproteobacteria bacterium]|jgi:ABC-type uncharacterized transport system involved in gliding motility auxiliary subunit|nr:GldG family protein [Gammaproteobacteria bacterium]
MRVHDVVFVVLLLVTAGLLGWLSTRYVFEADWTAAGRNTLSPASMALLQEMPGEVKVTAFARETIPLLRKRITNLAERYRRYKPDFTLVFVDPDREPQRARELDIVMDGEMVIEYRGRIERLRDPDPGESGLTNALQRVARGGERRLLFVTGHGERDPMGVAGHDLAGWAQYLDGRGIRAERINLLESDPPRADNSVVVLASPEVSLLPAEVARILDYVRDGGNLLWLSDPGAPEGLEPLAQELGIVFEAGVVVDPTVAQVGMMLFDTDDPRVALVARYPAHTITRDFDLNTLFPVAGAITAVEDAGAWQSTALLSTLSNTWLERGQMSGTITMDDGDVPGPLLLGVALSRAPANDGAALEDSAAREQRVVAVADGDFLGNAFLGRGGNLQLGLNMVDWLIGDDRFIDIPARTAPDSSLDLSRFATGAIGLGFPLVLPLLLAATGVVVWVRRRRR